ncbi:hypothetical protein KKF91_15025 [Myxococcota bacterium]|nr:hypothetical protein [Myxococcota bacterium]
MRSTTQLMIFCLCSSTIISTSFASQNQIFVEQALKYMGNEDLGNYYSYVPEFYLINDIIMYSWNYLDEKKSFSLDRYSNKIQCNAKITCASLSLYSNLSKVVKIDSEFIHSYVDEYGDIGISLLKIITSFKINIFNNIVSELNSYQIQNQELNEFTNNIVYLMTNRPSDFHQKINFLISQEKENSVARSILLFELIRSKNSFHNTVISIYESYLKTDSIISNEKIFQIGVLFNIALLVSPKEFLNRIDMNQLLIFSRKYNKERNFKRTITLDKDDIDDAGGLNPDFILGYNFFNISLKIGE